MDTLAVRLVVPLAGSTGDLHPQVIRPAPPVPEQRPSRRYAPCLAHNEKGGPWAAFGVCLNEYQLSTITASISTGTPLGNAATPTAARAGYGS